MIASMATGAGRMAVVLPQGALFHKGAEGQIRKALIECDLIEAVIGMPPNVFYGTGLAPAIAILRRSKSPERKGRILVIDASSLVRRGRAQNFLDLEHAEQIVGWVDAFEDVEGRAKVADLSEIEAKGWTLNPSRFVLPPIGAEIQSLPEAVGAFQLALDDARAAEDRLRGVLTDEGWLS
jgi:type I restriction enzyme M protein